MKHSLFFFIKNNTLRKNLDITFEHIVTLIPLIEDAKSEEAKSAFRTTVIIHASSIVEALLFSIVDKKYTNQALGEKYAKWTWKPNSKKILHVIKEDEEEMVGGVWQKKPDRNIKKEKFNLGQICALLREGEILDASLFSEIERLRKLRNDQHLSTHRGIRMHTKKDLNQAVVILEGVYNFVGEFYGHRA